MLLKIVFILFCALPMGVYSMQIDYSDYVSLINRLDQLRTGQERLQNTLDLIMTKLNLSEFPRSCESAVSSGIQKILPLGYNHHPFRVNCDADTQDGGWIIILRRLGGSENFYSNWAAYKEGFGQLDGEFFLGLYKIHALTAEKNQELLFLLEDYDGNEKYEFHEKFAIGNEQESYKLHTLGKANGSAGDSFRAQFGQKFSTFDRDNDPDMSRNCAVSFTGAWWYRACHGSQLTGKYDDNSFGKGINWKDFRGFEYSLKRVVMMIRKRK